MSEFKQIMKAGSECGMMMPEAWQQKLFDSSRRARKSVPLSRSHNSQNSFRNDVNQAIETEIVPRLMMNHLIAQQKNDEAQLGGFSIGTYEVEHFAALVVTQGTSVSYAYIESLRDQGLGLQEIYLKLLSPAAQYLGHLWEQDLCDFVDVTIGLGCLQQLIHALSTEEQYVTQPVAGNRSVLLAVSPGEQHTFGVLMVSEFFNRAGWRVTNLGCVSANEIVGTLRASHFDVVGLSASAGEYAECLTPLIRSVRRVSTNKSIGVMVGGPVFQADPGSARSVGADVSALNGREAVHNASKLLDSIDLRCSEDSKQ